MPLIERNVLLDEINKPPIENGNRRVAQILGKILDASEVDAVPVVRCKDCKYRYKPDDDPAYKTLPVRPDAIWCYWVDGNDDWFCPYGIRKDDDK